MSYPHPHISRGIVQSFSKLWQNHALEDFEVTVDGDIYSCHSLILASHSEFFSGLLRSNMKEKQDMKAQLSNISSSTFRLVLKTLYAGCELLTKESVLEVWSAVHQLQIQFLIEHCEDFVIANLSLDRLETYKQHGEFLQSEKVCKSIFNFMLMNFGTLTEKEILLRLDFQYLTKLLKSDKLKVNSEDLVLDLILEWVKYGNILSDKYHAIMASTVNQSADVPLFTKPTIEPTENKIEQNKVNTILNVNIISITEEKPMDYKYNKEEQIDRNQFLYHLLKASRYYLASDECIVRLYKDELIQNDMLARDCLFEALNFKFVDYVQGYWPTTAIHRDCSRLDHVAVCCSTRRSKAFSFRQNKWFSIHKLPKDLNTRLAVFKGKLYASLLGSASNKIYVFQKNTWIRVEKISFDAQLLLAHEKYLYVLGSNGKHITRFNPNSSHIKLETFVHEIQNLTYALSFHNNIVVFSSVENNGVEETAVHSWNTETQVWTQLGNLNFSSKNMTSFRDDKDTYIMDACGHLWKLTNSGSIGFAFVTKLWSEKYPIKGAVLFRETLYIFVGSPGEITVLDKVEGVYTSKIILEVAGNTSNVVHHVISKNKLKPTKRKGS